MCAIETTTAAQEWDNLPENSEACLEPETSDVSRRSLFSLGAIAAGVLAAESTSQAQAAPYNPTARWTRPELRLVRRITNGLERYEVFQAKNLGFDNYLKYHLAYTSIPNDNVENFLSRRYPALKMDAVQLYRQKDQWQIQQQLVGATLFRAAFSKRQLYERMVEFWSDHFNIYYPKVGILKVVDDRTVVRANALKTFPDLLKASAHSAAMMVYLDNASSPRIRPNQNYGRELLELHTMGVNGGYTQKDVLEVARCFTGWTVNWDCNSTNYGEFVFNPAGHDNGKKIVLGVTIPERGGKNDGDMVLKILAEHPSTARHISYKMARWLLQYEPSEALVTEVARVYTNNKGDVRSMVRAILREKYLVIAPAKFKRPSQHFVSMLRVLGVGVEDPLKLTWPLRKLGQPLFEWPAPNGYPDSLGYWVGGQLPRWNTGAMMAYGWLGASFSIEAYKGLTPRQFLSKINDNLFGGEMDAADRADLLAYVASRPDIKEGTIREAMALAFSLPSFQWY